MEEFKGPRQLGEEQQILRLEAEAAKPRLPMAIALEHINRLRDANKSRDPKLGSYLAEAREALEAMEPTDNPDAKKMLEAAIDNAAENESSHVE